jgi:bilirubin oxidase
MFHCHNLVHEDHDMLVAFNITQLEKWGYTNDTRFIDPMEPEFRPKNFDPADYTTDAILKKLDWFYSTDAYNQGNLAGISSALDAYSTGGARAPATLSNIASLGSLSAKSVTSGSPSSTAIGMASLSQNAQSTTTSAPKSTITSTPKVSGYSAGSLTFSTRTRK